MDFGSRLSYAAHWWKMAFQGVAVAARQQKSLARRKSMRRAYKGKRANNPLTNECPLSCLQPSATYRFTRRLRLISCSMGRKPLPIRNATPVVRMSTMVRCSRRDTIGL